MIFSTFIRHLWLYIFKSVRTPDCLAFFFPFHFLVLEARVEKEIQKGVLVYQM